MIHSIPWGSHRKACSDSGMVEKGDQRNIIWLLVLVPCSKGDSPPRTPSFYHVGWIPFLSTPCQDYFVFYHRELRETLTACACKCGDPPIVCRSENNFPVSPHLLLWQRQDLLFAAEHPSLPSLGLPGVSFLWLPSYCLNARTVASTEFNLM